MSAPNNKIDLLGPEVMLALVGGALTDFITFFLFLFSMVTFGIFLPLVVIVHLGLALVCTGFLFIRVHHFIPRLILGAAIVLPLPLLALGVIFSLIMQNRIVEAIVTQVAFKAAEAAFATTGAGAPVAAALEAAGDAKAAATAARTGVEAAELATQSGRAAAGAERGLQAGISATEQGGEVRTAEQGAAGVGGAKRPGERLAEEIYKEQDPYTKMKKMFEEVPTTTEENEEDAEEGVLVDDDTNSVDLRNAA